MKRKHSLLIIGIVFLAAGVLGLGSRRAYAAGEATDILPSDGNRVVVSTDTGSGGYFSPMSTSYVYVPLGVTTASVTVRDIRNGGLSQIAVRYLDNSNVCQRLTNLSAGPDLKWDPTNNTSITFNVNQPSSGPSNVKDLSDGSASYKVFCVQIATDLLAKGGSSNVTSQIFTTTPGVKIGAYAGGSDSIGTGYFTSTPGIKWTSTIAFAPTCESPAGSNDNINLYDLDNGYSQGYIPPPVRGHINDFTWPRYWTIPEFEQQPPSLDGNAWVALEKVNRLTGLSEGFVNITGVVESTPTVDVSNGTITAKAGYRTLGNFWYGTPNNTTWWVRPADGYNPLYKYVLRVGGLGGGNKIRIRIPYDQINASLQCIKLPTGEVTVTCSQVAVVAGKPITDEDKPGAQINVHVWRDELRPGNGASARGNPVATGRTDSGGSLDPPIEIGQFSDFRKHTFNVYAEDVDGSGNATGTFALIGSVTVGPCAPVACGELNVSPYPPEAERSFTIQPSFTYSAGNNPSNIMQSVDTAASNAAGRFKIIIRQTNAGGSVASILPSNPTPLKFTPASVGIAPDTTGLGVGDDGQPLTISGQQPNVYRVSWNVYDAATGEKLIKDQATGADADCTRSIVVGDLPYFRVYDGDVVSGGSFNSTTSNGDPFRQTWANVCTGTVRNSTAGIRAFNRSYSDKGIVNGGSASQLAALALGDIQGGFITATGRVTAPKSPKGLTLSNTPNSGSFGAAPCIPDYFVYLQQLVAKGTLQDVDVNVAPTLNLNQGNLDKAKGNALWYKPNGGTLTINNAAGNEIRAGRRVAVFVDGNVIINTDVKYVNADASGRAIIDIPSFYLIVHGNIYIQPGVKQLDGVYAALPAAGACAAVNSTTYCPTNALGTYSLTDTNPASGSIYTCANGTTVDGNPAFRLFLLNSCNNQLVVNGAFQAAQVRFLRTNGTIRKAQGGGEGERRDSSNIAEVFNYTPELYLNSPFDVPTYGNTFNSIGNLAPTL